MKFEALGPLRLAHVRVSINGRQASDVAGAAARSGWSGAARRAVRRFVDASCAQPQRALACDDNGGRAVHLHLNVWLLGLIS